MKYVMLVVLVLVMGFVIYSFVGSASMSLLSVPLNFGGGGAKDSKSQETGKIITETATEEVSQ